MARTITIRPEQPLETAAEIIAALEGAAFGSDQVRFVCTLGGKVKEIKITSD